MRWLGADIHVREAGGAVDRRLAYKGGVFSSSRLKYISLQSTGSFPLAGADQDLKKRLGPISAFFL